MSVAGNICKIKSQLPAGVRLIAVSKTRTPQEILEAYSTGHLCFGENKARELAVKYLELPSDVEWHFIGHLQSNKVKQIVPFVSLIHSVDSLKLLMNIDKEAVRCKRIIPCLLQIYIAYEETKFGLSEVEACALLESEEYGKLKNIRIDGVMGMATNTEDMDQVRQEFHGLKLFFLRIKEKFFAMDDNFCEISMGMSSDYKVAIEEGTTIVRIGSNIFGERNYR